MIGFNYVFVQPLIDSGISFRSDEYLAMSRVPVLILHADNDWVVPAGLSRRVSGINVEHVGAKTPTRMYFFYFLALRLLEEISRRWREKC